MTLSESQWILITGGIFAAMIGWQLYSGTAFGGRRLRRVRRADFPRDYWIRIAFQSVVAVFLLVYSSTTSPASRAANAAAAKTWRAYELQRANRFAEAVPLYDSLLASADTNTELHFFRGVAHFNLAHKQEALADFKRVIAVDDTNFVARQFADRILGADKRWDESLSMWNDFIAKNPAKGIAYYERGGANYNKGSIAAAMADAVKACELGYELGCTQAAQFGAKKQPDSSGR